MCICPILWLNTNTCETNDIPITLNYMMVMFMARSIHLGSWKLEVGSWNDVIPKLTPFQFDKLEYQV